MVLNRFIVICSSGEGIEPPKVFNTREAANDYVNSQVAQSVKEYFDEADEEAGFDTMNSDDIIAYGTSEDVVDEEIIKAENDKDGDIRRLSFTGNADPDDDEHYIIYPVAITLTNSDISSIIAHKPAD